MFKSLIRDHQADRHLVARSPRAARIRRASWAWCRGENSRQAFYPRASSDRLSVLSLIHCNYTTHSEARQPQPIVRDTPTKISQPAGAPDHHAGHCEGRRLPRSNLLLQVAMLVWNSPDPMFGPTGKAMLPRRSLLRIAHASPVVDKLSEFAYTCQPGHPINAIIKEANL